jgi:RHS repeat-associated protein
VRRQLAADGLVTEYVHDARGSLVSVAYPSGLLFALGYDAHGRLVSIHESGVLARSFEYNSRHEVVAETDARGARATFTHDGMGRPVTRIDALGRATRVSYDRLGRAGSVRFPDGGALQRVHDARGNIIRETDALGQVTAMEYAGMGVLSRLVQPDGGQWTLSYTRQERLASIQNPRGESHVFSYDEAGRIVEEKTFDGRVTSFGYSGANRLARVEYPDGSSREFSHDRVGRLASEEASDGSVVAYQRDRLGRLVGAILDENGERRTTLFERDRLGRVVVERQEDRAIRYAYDTLGRRIEREMPDGTRTRYGYDAGDALVSVDQDGHRVVLERDALGREIRRGDIEGRLSIHSSYDAMDRLIDQRATAPSPGDGVPEALVQRQWQYDRIGRAIRIDDARWGSTTYRYDRADHLAEALRGVHREVFAYDRAGGLVSALAGLGSAQGSWEAAPGSLIARTETAKYTYDKRGRRTVKLALGGAPEGAATEYTWDVRDRLRAVKLPDGTRVVMTYDALGRRIRKAIFAAGSTPTPRRVTDFVWDGSTIAADLDSERGARGFVHRPGSFVPLLQVERGTVFTYVNDHLGMPRELLRPGGEVAWSATHGAWGNVVEARAPRPAGSGERADMESPFRLLGQYADDETGLCSTRYRYFDPEIGRWLSPDPIGIEGGMDLFGFNGSPTVDVDPLGLMPMPEPVDETETVSGRPVRARDVTTQWDSFLGPGPHTNTHPRTGAPDPDRIASADGTRSIRYGNHESGSPSNLHHYHEETWSPNPATGGTHVDNTIRRIQNPPPPRTGRPHT